MSLFTYKRNRDYITLYMLGIFRGNYDNWEEVREAEHDLLSR